ncbi:MAG: SO_0444 family Cu/Zn efflux transporter [Candidatus Zixiibacteriota bacterium]
MSEILSQIVVAVWSVILQAAPYLVLGFIAAMLIYAMFPKDRVHSLLGKPGLGSILKASLLGIPLPLCSCGVLPTALSLNDKGASKGATVSFLVSTPETGVDSIAVTWALINPAMTILRPLAAFVSSVVAGVGVERFARRASTPQTVQAETCTSCGCGDSASSVDSPSPKWPARLRDSLNYIVRDFFPDIANWLLLGFVLSGIAAAFLPSEFLLGLSPTSQLILAVVAGVPIYICASASTPIAAVLMMKGLSPGAALVFLLVGPATNFASLLVIGRRLGTRTAAVYLGSVIITALAIGAVVNAFTGHWNWIPNIASPLVHEHIGVVNWISAGILLLGILSVWVRPLWPASPTPDHPAAGRQHSSRPAPAEQR